MQKVIWQRTNITQRRKIPNRRKFNIKLPKTGLFKIFVGLSIIVLLALLVWWVGKNNSIWIYRETNYVGLVNLKPQDVEPLLENFKTQHIWRINNTKIENLIRENFIQISNVRVEKVYPDRLNIIVEEKVPYIVYKNFNGVYLVDTNGEILEAIVSDNDYKFTARDYNLAQGFGNPNADYVEDRIIANFNDEELEEFNFEEYDFNLKVQALNSIVEEVKIKFDGVLNKSETANEFSERYGVPVISAWDEQKFSKGEFIDFENIKFWGEAINKITNLLETPVAYNTWDGRFRLFVNIDQDSVIILSPRRELDQQIEDLNLIIRSQQINPLEKSRIDLSSEKILVE